MEQILIKRFGKNKQEMKRKSVRNSLPLPTPGQGNSANK